MKIEELSSTLDEKLAQANEQMQTLKQQRAEAGDQQLVRQLDRDIAALDAAQQKLLKSRAIAWRAHQLNEEMALSNRRIELERRLGLGLIIASGVGLVALGWVAYGMYF
jgi:hypothetical protein